jgi:hypothetical protein
MAPPSLREHDMSLLIRELERQERRVLGALRCVDATTGVAIADSLQVVLTGASVLHNRSGLYVIASAAALPAHEAAFADVPAAPPVGSVSVSGSIRDPQGRYLPRLISLALPRDSLPAHADNADSLFNPIDVPLYPASAAPLGSNWSVLRVSVTENASGDALGGALLRVTQGPKVLARGLTDWRGEALVAVPGVPVTTWSDDPHAVIVSEINAQLEVVFDAASGTRVAMDSVRDGRPPALQQLVDPDEIEAQRATLPNATQAIVLAAGRAQTVFSPLALP